MTNRDASGKINAIRNAALASLGAAPHANCPTCTRIASAPYRRHDERGKVTEGCIDAFHTDALSGIIGESTAWHFRAEAVAIRRAELKALEATAVR